MNYEIDKYKSDYHLTALGIGDIILTLILLKNKLINESVFINLFFFVDNFWYPNPSNALKFRISLINHILEQNKNIDKKILYTYYDNKNTNYLNQHLDYYKYLDHPEKWHLNLNCQTIIEDPYIVFHTKARFHKSFDMIQFRKKLIDLCKRIKSKYKIILLGERNFPNTFETNYINLTTIYQELLTLKTNNNVIDMTLESIYNELDIDNYFKDIGVVSNAKYNMLVGMGGLLVSCLAFNHNSVINYTSHQADNIYIYPKYFDDVYFFKDFDKYEQIVLEKLNRDII